MNKEYIEKEAANKELQRFSGYLDEDMIFRLRFAINRLPAADVKPVVRGEWKISPLYQYAAVYKCSFCDYLQLHQTRFCPNCGAAMRKEEVE